jgi:hypothetical protein
VVSDISVGTAAKDYSKMASTKDLKPVEIKLRKITDTAGQIHREVQYLREREEQMRNTNKTIETRVVGYSIATLAFLLVLSAIQVIYLKRFFRAKKII